MQYDEANGPYLAVDKDDAEMAGLVKYDFLGLQTLTIVKKTGVDISSVDLNDPETLSIFRKGDTNGVFQFESSGMRKLLIDMQPEKFSDIVAANALYRPGPIENGLVDLYVRNKKNPDLITYDFPELEPILKETYGVLCYQEQVMKISQVIAGFSMAEADTLRKAIGKKKADLMAKLEKQFIEGGVKNGFDKDKVIELYEKIKKFAKYSFNKSHSAAYAKLAMQTAYLKRYHLAKFLAAAIAVEASDHKKVYEYILEAKRHGIEVIIPSLNTSTKDAEAINGKIIRLGLNNLKGFGESAIEDIIKNRPFTDPIDLLSRTTKVNKTMVKKLIAIGAFDFTGEKREDWFITVDKYNKNKQKKNFSAFLTGEMNTSIKKAAFKWDNIELAQKEYEAFGFFLNYNPIAFYSDLMVYSNYDEIVFIEKVKKTKTRKKGEEMAILKVTDFKEYKEIPFFPKVWKMCPCKEGDVVMIKYSEGYPAEAIKAEDAKFNFKYMFITAPDNVSAESILQVLHKYPEGNITTEIENLEVNGPYVAYNLEMIEELKQMGCKIKFSK